MKTTIKIGFNELSKSVTAEAKIEIEVDNCSLEDINTYKEEVLKMSKELMDKATDYSKHKTINK